MSKNLRQESLSYHLNPIPGKIAIEVIKPTNTQYDLSLAYTPGVAEPVREIAKDANNAYLYTAKGNLVAVISNGSAILGLGNLGALASKPVMEGKAVLFKKFAGIDVFDIEVDCETCDDFIKVVKSIAPTFGGINLEDIKSPECFKIEQELQSKLNIPVFHDDQHGTAIIVSAGLLNALELRNKNLSDVKIVCLGAGAAGIATMQLLLKLGATPDNINMVDRSGVITTSRLNLPAHKLAFARNTDNKTLSDAMRGADVFIGVSGPNLLNAMQLNSMGKDPIVFALSNPDPEIHPDIVIANRPDCIIATGRSDFANQVNNVLCFPFIFRGALDVRSTCINQEMCIAAVHAIRSLAKSPIPKEVIASYPNSNNLSFGANYLIPKPTDPRLKDHIAPAVAYAAITSGVAQLPYPKNYPPLDEMKKLWENY